MKIYYVYFMANKNNTALYTGMTNNLERRVKEHKGKLNSGFTNKYNCNKLVYFEELSTAISAINREKQIKAGSRKKKNELVNSMNSDWIDLAQDW
jgi:putative endonuclease